MSTLNRKWMVSTFLTVQAATAAGSFTPINAAYPEIADLTERKYVKQNKKLHNKDGEVAYVAVKGANVVDLLTDLGYTLADQEELSTIVSSEVIEQMAQAQGNAAAPTAPQTPVTPAAPVAPAVPQTPVTPATPETPVATAAVPTAADVAANIPAAPTLGGVDLGATTATPVQQNLEGVDAGVDNEIDLDVVFGGAAKPVSKLIDYDKLVQTKLAHPESQPSIHIANRKSKDISVQVKKQADFYEKENGITFRVRTVHANDPKGAGVRIFALTVAEAPERRQFGAKAGN